MFTLVHPTGLRLLFALFWQRAMLLFMFANAFRLLVSLFDQANIMF